jgi:hypothetical protein
MSYFKLINENNSFSDEEITTTTKEFNAEYLYEVIENFEMFLRGCGYHFNGHLDFVQDEEITDDSDDLPDSSSIEIVYGDPIIVTGVSEKQDANKR